MSVTNISSLTSSSQTNLKALRQQGEEDFAQLFQAMQAGNLASAQQAYGALQQWQSNFTTTDTSSSTGSSTSTGTTTTADSTSSASNAVLNDWNALGQALQSGNLSSAQSAFSSLESDAATAASQIQGRHHHHGTQEAQSVYSAMQSTGATSGSTSSSTGDTVSNDLAALKQALQNGSTSSAQDLLAKLEQDLQASRLSGHHHQSQLAAQNASQTTTTSSPSVTSVATTAVNGVAATAAV